MKLYKISQSAVSGYDTFSEAVVAAPDRKTARRIYPRHRFSDGAVQYIPHIDKEYYPDDWTNDPADVTVELLGDARPGTKIGVICASFHAG